MSTILVTGASGLVGGHIVPALLGEGHRVVALVPFPVATDQLRQLRLDNTGPLDLVASRFGFEPRPMEGALGYLTVKRRDQIGPAANASDRTAASGSPPAGP